MSDTAPDGPREYTDDEARQMFLDHLAAVVRYWLHEDRAPEVEEKMTGLVHSILVAIDGGAAYLPGFLLVPSPHPDDTQFHRDEGENWWPGANDAEHDIAGGLHDQWGDACRRAGLKS